MNSTRSILLALLALGGCVAGSEEPDYEPTDDLYDDGKGDDPIVQQGQDPDGDGCVDGWCDPEGTPEVDPTCEPRTCEGQCGVIDDGCNGTVACGPCGCQPRTCEEAGATCGTIDDGCDGELDCNADPCSGECQDNQCVCAADALEPNDSSVEAVELGSLSQSDGVELQQVDLNLDSADDADWFRVTILDDYSWANPAVYVRVNGAGGGDVEVTGYYFCDYGPDYAHTCEHSAAYSDDFGSGCQGSSELTLHTECDWNDETGTIYIRIAPGEQAVACDSYSVSVEAI